MYHNVIYVVNASAVNTIYITPSFFLSTQHSTTVTLHACMLLCSLACIHTIPILATFHCCDLVMIGRSGYIPIHSYTYIYIYQVGHGRGGVHSQTHTCSPRLSRILAPWPFSQTTRFLLPFFHRQTHPRRSVITWFYLGCLAHQGQLSPSLDILQHWVV